MPQVRAAATSMDECSICLQDLDPDEMLLRLPCQHSFHKDCAVRWLTERNHLCPLCQTAVASPLDQGEEEGKEMSENVAVQKMPTLSGCASGCGFKELLSI